MSAQLIPVEALAPSVRRVTHRTRIIFVDTSFASGPATPPNVVTDAVQTQTYHAYGQWGAAPLCGTNEWRELVPDAEANCPFCRELLAPMAHGPRV